MRISTPASSIIPPVSQRVFINGEYMPDIYCTDVTSTISTASTASFLCPAIMWDEKNLLKGCKVAVEVSMAGKTTTIFFGFIQARTGDPSTQTCSFSAESPMGAMADLVYIGDGRTRKTQYARYPEYAMTQYGNLRKTNTTAADILMDFVTARAGITWRGLGSGMLPSCWQSVLSFGSLELLKHEIGEIVFDGVTLRSALDEVCKKVSNIGWREKFTLSGVKLEFFTLAGDIVTGSAPKTIICARAGEAVAGTHVASISSDISTADAFTRVIGHGAECSRILSVPYWADGVARAHALLKGWNPILEPVVLEDLAGAQKADSTATQSLDDEPELEPEEPIEPPEEEDPLPEGEEPEDPQEDPEPTPEPEDTEPEEPAEPIDPTKAIMKQLQPECDKVFRIFKLPVSLIRECRYFAENFPVESLKLCAVKLSKKLFWANGWVAGCPSDFFSGYYSTTEVQPEVITDVKLNLENYTIELPQMVSCTGKYANLQGDTVQKFEPCNFYITLAVYENRLIFDTGLPGNPTFLPLGREGLTLRIQNENFKRILIGSSAYPVTYLWDEKTLSIIQSPAAWQDDSKNLQRLCQAILAEKSEEKTAYSITIPWLDSSYKVGDRVILRGVTDFDYGRHTISSVTYSPVQDHSTSISTDNSGITYSQSVFDSYGSEGE